MHLTAALEVLSEHPDVDTINALEQLASVESFAGTAAAKPLTEDALELAGDLDAPPAEWPAVLNTRAIYLDNAGRRREAAMYFREAARLADEHGVARSAAMARVNLTNLLNMDDPAAAVVVRVMQSTRRCGASTCTRWGSVSPTSCWPSTATGDWDEADDVVNRHPNGHLVADDESVVATAPGSRRFAANRTPPRSCSANCSDLPASEDAQDLASVATARAFVATARDDLVEALRWSRCSLEHVERALSFAGDDGRWAWPLAARCAHQLGDLTAEAELLDICDRQRPGQLAPMQRAEALLIRARLAAAEHAADAADQFVAAIEAVRSISTPYHLAHGLLDHAEFLAAMGDSAAPDEAIAEARSIAIGLGCRPLLDRVDALTAAAPAAQDAIAQR